jgi:hypothetical protein
MMKPANRPIASLASLIDRNTPLRRGIKIILRFCVFAIDAAKCRPYRK